MMRVIRSRATGQENTTSRSPLASLSVSYYKQASDRAKEKGQRLRCAIIEMPPTPDAYWLALRRVKGIGPRIARLLLERFQSPEQIFAQAESALVGAGISRSVAHNIAGFDGYAAIDKELCELQRVDGRLIRWSDPEYPPALRQIADPPPFLFVRGTMPAGGAPCVAVVGARAASDVGLRMARRLGFELAAKGFTVVSGLARGIDGEAHQGALDAWRDHDRSDGMRYRRDLSRRASPSGGIDSGQSWRLAERAAGWHPADWRELSHSQPDPIGVELGRRDRRGGREKRLANHGPDGAGSGSAGVRRPG